jgi:NAD(P)-dependent dehydrogenase (short-subunit alcohol dehydrogenase family)
MSLLAALKGKGENGFGYGTTAEEATAGVDLSGKRILVTGVNAGLGLETLRVLHLRGAHVVAAARTVDKAAGAIAAAGASGRATPIACELSEPSAVRACVDEVRGLGRPLDVILCNAGIMALPKLEQKLGYELQFFTNHIGHFLLVTGLLDRLTDDGRVVMLSSAAHKQAPRDVGIELDNLSGERGYGAWKMYGQSKLANMLFASELARRFAGSGRVAFSIHPGVIRTELVRHLNPVMRGAFALAGPIGLKTIPQGAATQCYAAAHPDARQHTGKYLADCNPAETTRHGRDAALAARLWAVSEEIAAKV